VYNLGRSSVFLPIFLRCFGIQEGIWAYKRQKFFNKIKTKLILFFAEIRRSKELAEEAYYEN